MIQFRYHLPILYCLPLVPAIVSMYLLSVPEMALPAYSIYSSHLRKDQSISDASYQLLILSGNSLHGFQTHVHVTLWTTGG